MQKILGIDLGTASIGWSLLEQYEKNTKLLDLGCRIFEAGLDGDIESGKAESPCAERRAKRSLRRRLKRRRQRKYKVVCILQKNGLLPKDKPVAEAVKAIDKREIERILQTLPDDMPEVKHLPQLLPYYLRASALDRKLSPHALGRALYHLAQRRGYFSNSRRDSAEDDEGDEEKGAVKKGISDLRHAMSAMGARTLGEFFLKQNPHERTIRRRYTERAMYKEEFQKICKAQKLSDAVQKALYKAIFFQRKLKGSQNLIGKCSLEPRKRRAPLYHPDVERFIMLQTLNHLRIQDTDENRALTAQERAKLIRALCGEGDLLESKGRLAITKAKKLLKLPRGTKFSLELSGEKHLPGCYFAWKMRAIFGMAWESFSEEKKALALQDAVSIVKESARLKRARGYWNLDEAHAKIFAELVFKDGYAALSLKAIRTLLPDLEAGADYATARERHYPFSFKATDALEQLPPLRQVLSDLRNPLVNRTLTELRKVVNAVIAKYGKPDCIHIELARDLKNSAHERDTISKKNRANEERRETARKEFLKAFPNASPSGRDILKLRLWEECHKECPYTGKSIGLRELLSGAYDIEHIIPYSRSLDDSFNNKTLCKANENRNIKQNKTPYEAYGANPECYEAILQRVRRFKNPRKLRLFEIRENSEIDAMPDRMLNDTRYASKLATEYLALLYGGLNDSLGKKRIYTNSGAITALMRKEYGFNDILGDGVKNRGDHRHHAVDAVAIALTSSAVVKRLTNLFKNLPITERAKIFKESWLKTDNKDLYNALFKRISALNASHHAPSKVRGALHEDTIYAKPKESSPQNEKYQRIALAKIGKKDIEKIVDPAIRERVQTAFEASGLKDPAKFFSDAENLPTIENNGDLQKIRAVKVRINKQTETVGRGDKARGVVLGNNHHLEIVANLNAAGEEISWEGHVVSMLEAYRRKKEKEPIIQRDWGANKRFKFSLTQKDVVRFVAKESVGPEYFVVRSIGTAGQHAFVKLNDARLQKDIKQSGEWITSMVPPLKDKQCEKFKMTPLGELRRAHD